MGNSDHKKTSGVHWRLSDGATELLLLDAASMRVLSGTEPVNYISWAMRAMPELEQRALARELHGFLSSELCRVPPHCPDLDSLLPALADALQMGDLIALEVPSVPAISQAEIDMLEAMRRKRRPSVDAPPPRPRPAPDSTPLHEYPIRVIDDTGTPVSGVKLKLEIDGTPRMAITDADGRASPQWFSTRDAAVRILDEAGLQQQLQPRWALPRASALPSGPRVYELSFGETLPEVRAGADQTTTMVLARPYFRCKEICGTHFDFGRSFVRSSALEPLADIAESIHEKDRRLALVVGHTDRAGSEALNKELSERRARAVHALLTHDADAWERLFSGTDDGPHWQENWGVLEAQHMLNALRVTDDHCQPLVENGVRDEPTKEAIRRFQRREYPDVPAEQIALPESDFLGADGRRELFLAYAKRIGRKPVSSQTFVQVGGAPFLGCGEYNPLSESARDAESRRVVVFVFDAVMAPAPMPCAYRSLQPCKQRIANDDAGQSPSTYRCCAYRALAAECPCQGGVDLSHDLVLRFPLTLQQADGLPHVYIFDSEDGTIVRQKFLATDARANDEGVAEICFSELPPNHAYRLQCREDSVPYTVFDYLPLEDLRRFSQSQAVEEDATEIASAFDTKTDSEASSNDAVDGDEASDSTRPAYVGAA